MERRRAPRHAVNWTASYRFGSAAQWRPCRVIDLTLTGIAIEPFDLRDDDPLSGRVEIHLGLPDDIPEVFELLGNIRHRTRTSAGRIHLGIEFKDLTTLDAMTLDELRRVRNMYA
jgi:hypothetical protein